MPRDRVSLNVFSDRSLADRSVTVEWQSDRFKYTLLRLLKEQGKTSVTWQVRDNFDRLYALKFVLQTDYATHSLDAEMRRAAMLPKDLFATIPFFGEPSIEGFANRVGEFYAILVDWFDGRSFEEYINDPAVEISPEVFCQLARDLCAVIQSLRLNGLVHNDLHNQNILVHETTDVLSGATVHRLFVVDTGTLKTEERKHELLESWELEAATIEPFAETNEQAKVHIRDLRRRIAWFGRTDQEQIVSHLCDAYNSLRRSSARTELSAARFVTALPDVLALMVDHDPSRRLSDPKKMNAEINRAWQESLHPESPKAHMPSPFDLPSAELIRSDRQLMAIFSEEYPRLDICRSDAPVYLYGPRGCGKSTILRSMSLKAALASESPLTELGKTPFVGMYLSSSQELRSRFWLMKEPDFEALEGHVVRYFTLLLADTLVDTLDCMFKWDASENAAFRFGISETIAEASCELLRARMGLNTEATRYAGTSHFTAIRQAIRRQRDELWLKILDREESRLRADAQLIFQICHDLEEAIPFLQTHRLCFLIDDYSKQRIPAALQRRLNQVITFSKQSSPIFKVTSEYDGVDLDGIQQPREVTEVNVGYEYVSFENDPDRYRFLRSVLELRFKYASGGKVVDLLRFLPPSGLQPAMPLARAIEAAHAAKRRFYYHGLDTLSDVCSGDFAMGIDLIRRIFEDANVRWEDPAREIPAHLQHNAIREYARQEYEFIRYLSGDGRQKHAFAESLGWLSRECVTTRTTEKNGVDVPVIKNHLDITENALRELERPEYADAKKIFDGLVSRGILFPIDPSRSRIGNYPTRRYMLRRILLAKHTTALGRQTAIKIEDVQRLLFLLQEPQAFAEDELRRMSVKIPDKQQSLPFEFDG